MVLAVASGRDRGPDCGREDRLLRLELGADAALDQALEVRQLTLREQGIDHVEGGSVNGHQEHLDRRFPVRLRRRSLAGLGGGRRRCSRLPPGAAGGQAQECRDRAEAAGRRSGPPPSHRMDRDHHRKSTVHRGPLPGREARVLVRRRQPGEQAHAHRPLCARAGRPSAPISRQARLTGHIRASGAARVARGRAATLLGSPSGWAAGPAESIRGSFPVPA